MIFKQMTQPHFDVRIPQFAPLALLLAGAVIAVAFYLPALHYPFISDDTGYITDNEKLAGLNLTDLWRLFTEPYNDFTEFLPLRDLSYWIDLSLFGPNPAAFRIHSILLYLLCLPLVYGATREVWRYFRPTDASAPWAAAAITALFALHPSHTEAVVWIAGRKDVLSGMLALLTLWLALRARRAHGLSAPYAAATLAALLAAMLSKATAVAVAPVIALLWMMFWLDIPAPQRRRAVLLWPLAGLVLAGCVTLIIMSFVTSRVPLYFGMEAVTRSLAVLGWLARLALSPETRHFFYPVFEDPYLPAMVVFGGAVLAAALAGLVWLLRRRSLEGFALVVFLLICVPSLQLIPYAPPSLVSDRFVFLAVWPATLLVVALSWRLRPLHREAFLLVIALAWGFQAAERTRDWRSFEALVEVDLKAFPGYSMPAMHESDIQLSKGLLHEAGETANSIAIPEVKNIMVKLVQAHQVVTNSSSIGNAHDAMIALLDFGRDLQNLPLQAQWNTPVSIIWRTNRRYLGYEWQNLAKRSPSDVSVRYNAGLSLMAIQDYEGAISHLVAASTSQQLPEFIRGKTYTSLGLALIKSGRAIQAEAPFRAALEQSPPDLQAYCGLAEMYQQTNRPDEAARAGAACTGDVSKEKTMR